MIEEGPTSWRTLPSSCVSFGPHSPAIVGIFSRTITRDRASMASGQMKTTDDRGKNKKTGKTHSTC